MRSGFSDDATGSSVSNGSSTIPARTTIGCAGLVNQLAVLDTVGDQVRSLKPTQKEHNTIDRSIHDPFIFNSLLI